MIGSIFRQEIEQTTGMPWEEWIIRLQQTVNPSWSHEQIKAHVVHVRRVNEEWSEWIATMYGQLLGRVPVGVTKDAGVQIGVRRTLAVTKDQAWNSLISPQGLRLWLGHVSSMKWQKGYEYESKEGITGTITVIKPFEKLRMTWKRADWEQFSRLQIYLLAANGGKTTIAIHQEMLEDVYMREMMRRHWDEMLNQFPIQKLI